MTTAVVGLGNLGSRVARHLATGGERVVVASRHKADADRLAARLGEPARSATVPDAVDESDTVVLAVHLDTMRSLVPGLAGRLVGKVVVDPSNPVGPDGRGGMTRTLPEGQSAGSVVARMLPPGTHYAKAFGSIVAQSLGEAAGQQPRPNALYYATDDEVAAKRVERLIRSAGFAPVQAGGLTAAGRIEVGGDLHQMGGLNGQLLTESEARAAL